MRDALAGFLRETHLDQRLREQQVLTAWKASLDPELHQHARAVRFVGGELVVEVSSAALLGELTSFTGEALRKATNKRLGADRITSVSYKPRR